MTHHSSLDPSALARQDGFSLLESVIALSLLSVGLLTMAAGFAQGMQQMTGSNFDFLAREKAAEAIESVFTARDTKLITWAEIMNELGESGSDGGIFEDGETSMTLAGPDGLVNTEDDPNNLVESVPEPGVDGLLGTADDTSMELTNFTREIEIRSLGPTLRQLRVIIRYTVGGAEREYEIITYISSYA